MNYRKSLLLTCAALAATCAQAAPDVPTLKPGVITIGSDMTWPPYEHVVKGEPAGFDVEFMQKMAAHLSLKPQFDDTRFASLILGLSGKRFDVVVSALYVTPERAQQIDYVPYLKTGGSLVTAADSAYAPRRIDELCGKRVASLKGAAWVPLLADASKTQCMQKGKDAIQVQEYPSSPIAAQALLSRGADVQFEDAAVSQMLVTQTNKRLRITSTEILNPVVVGIGVPKGNKAMLDALSAALDQLKRSGDYQALLKKYNLGEPSAAEIDAAYGKSK
jgi:polar amino acid transport system substrate-binding protein